MLPFSTLRPWQMTNLEPAGWTDPTTAADLTTEDDFQPAPPTCPHCRKFYSQQQWQIEQQGRGREVEFVLWCKCSNCGGYIERVERHG